MANKDFVKVRQAAKELDLSRQTIYRMAEAGLIESTRVSPHSIRIPVSEIARIKADRSGEFARQRVP